MPDLINRFQFNMNDFKEDGLYLLTKDKRLEFTNTKIKGLADEFWNNSAKLSADIKEATEFKRCDFCPLNETGNMCDAIRPTLPLIDQLGGYNSFDQVTAIYKEVGKKELHIADTDMQNALRYISILSLTQYCQKAKMFYRYFKGVIPIMDSDDVAKQIYMNIYWINRGEEKLIQSELDKFKKVLFITTQNQNNRLDIIMKEDSLKNAFAIVHIVSELLSMNAENLIKKSLE
ncbi:MAG: hypothetical protein ABIE74_04880 [Pseudomonadota bacterium]